MKEYQTLYGKDEIPTIRSGGAGSTSKKHCWDLIQVKALTETRTEESKAIRKESMKNGKDFSPRRGKEIKLREDDNANTITANQGVEQLIVLQIKSATKDGFEEATEGDSINLSMPNSKTRRGRVGVAQTLDTQANQSVVTKFLKNGTEIKTDTRNILSKLQEEVGEEKITEWGFRILNSLQEEKILRPEVYGKRIRQQEEERESWLDDSAFPCKKTQENLLRKMWQQKEFGCSSHKWGLARQFFKEFTDALQKLPYKNPLEKKDMQGLPTPLLLQRLLHETLSTLGEVRQPVNDESESTYTSNIRRLTEIEVEILQGLPPNHTQFGMYPKIKFSQEVFNELSNEEKVALFETELVRKEIPKGQRYKLCGNAVTRDVVELIGKKLLKSLTL